MTDLNTARPAPVDSEVLFALTTIHPDRLAGCERLVDTLPTQFTKVGRHEMRRTGDSTVEVLGWWGRFQYAITVSNRGALAIVAGVGVLVSRSAGRGVRTAMAVVPAARAR